MEFLSRLLHTMADLFTSNSIPELPTETWLLGLQYASQYDAKFEEDLRSRFYTTYRTGFERLGSTKGFTSDIGWGCMIRTGQALVGNALMYSVLGRNWRFDSPGSKLGEYCRVITNPVCFPTRNPDVGGFLPVNSLFRCSMTPFKRLYRFIELLRPEQGKWG